MTTIGLSYSLVKISTKCAPALTGDQPGHHLGIHPATDELPYPGGTRMVEQGGDQHAGDDGPGFAKTTDEQQRQELCLVADLGDGHAQG